MLMQLTILLDN